MGYEYITQPQIFLAPISAINGIEGINEAWPLLTTYQSWTSTASINASAFPIPGYWTMLNESGSFIVSVGGVIQPPSEYTVNRDLRILTFNSVVSAGVEIAATQLATAAPSSQTFNYVQAVSSNFNTISAETGFFNTLLVTNLTGLSTVVNIIDVRISEVSGFRSTGDVEILGSVNVTGNMTLSGSLNVGTNIAASTITVTDATVTNSDITNLIGNNITTTDANFTNLTATDIGTTNLTATDIGTTNLTATDIGTTNLTATDIGTTNLSANTAYITTPILSTDNSTQVATTNFVRQFGGFQNIAVYTSGTGTVDLSSLGEGIEKIKVTVVGGGGGGGGVTNSAGGNTGGGGGAGGALVKYIRVNSNQTSFTYTVGAAGTAGGSGTSGGDGGQSTLVYNSITYTANGGGFGTVNGAGGAGGTASNGDINITGQNGGGGGTASATNHILGGGGSTGFGFGIGGATPAGGIASGIAATGYGGGGSGGHTNTTTQTTGGGGAGGVVIVEW